MKQFLCFLCVFFWGVLVHAEALDPMGLRTFGKDKPIVVYLFTSAACPHCAAYHTQILPQLKKQFVKTGKVQLKIVDMPYDIRSFQAMQMARCMPEKSYEKFMNQVYQHQADWAGSKNSIQIFKKYARQAGMDESKSEKCMTDKDLTKRMAEQRNNLADLYRVRGMPTTVAVSGQEVHVFVGADEEAVLKGIEKVVKSK